jgi:alanine dehydrogenase
MRVDVIKEIKDKENRVALSPAGAGALHHAGHRVLVQTGAGVGSGFSDAQYRQAGAHIVTVEEVWSQLVGMVSYIEVLRVARAFF